VSYRKQELLSLCQYLWSVLLFILVLCGLPWAAWVIVNQEFNKLYVFTTTTKMKEFDKKGNSDLHPLYLYLTIQIESSNTNKSNMFIFTNSKISSRTFVCYGFHITASDFIFSIQCLFIVFVCLMVFNATFNNILAISWRSDFLVEKTGWPSENHRPVASHWQTITTNAVSSNSAHARCTRFNIMW
jgi:hypothetical protein